MDIILQGIGTFLGWLSAGTNSYILALLIFAVILEILLLPFSIKQQKNSIRQAKLRPKEMAIRKRYAGREDKVAQQKMQTEIQELYTRENYNPMSGCLPLLIQLPVLIFLYQIVINPLKYVLCMTDGAISAIVGVINSLGAVTTGYTINAGSTIGVISFISNPDNLNAVQAGLAAGGHESALAELNSAVSSGLPNFGIGALDLGGTPSITTFNILLLVPIITFAAYFMSMKLNRKFSFQPMADTNNPQTGCSNKMMDYVMPLMSVFIAFQVPAVVGVYWIMKSLIGTLKQFILSRALPIPPCTEEDIKAAEKELNARAPKKSSGGKTTRTDRNGNPIRSLHHIDDDDYDENGKFIERKPEPEENKADDTQAADAENGVKADEKKAGQSGAESDDKAQKTSASLMDGVAIKDDGKNPDGNSDGKSNGKNKKNKKK